MATHKDAMKRHRQNEKRRVRNRHYKSMMRNATKLFRSAIENNDLEKAKSLFPSTMKLIQKVGQKRCDPQASSLSTREPTSQRIAKARAKQLRKAPHSVVQLQSWITSASRLRRSPE